MSFPNIPNIDPNIGIDEETSANLLLASVALEELGLSHILNAEAEKIQYAVGTLNGRRIPKPASIREILQINDSVSGTMRNVIKNQMLLGMKMEDISRICNRKIHLNIATVTAEYNGIKVTANDKAYYYTKGGDA